MSANKNEIIRKLEVVKQMINEAEALVKEIPEFDAGKVLDMVSTQTELIQVLLESLANGKIQMDPEVDERFLKAARSMLNLKKAELKIEMDAIEAEYLARMKNKNYKQ